MKRPHHSPHSPEELDRVFHAVQQYGARLRRIAFELGMTAGQVAGIKRRHRAAWNRAVAAFLKEHPTAGAIPAGLMPAEDVQQTHRDGGLDARSYGTRIKTVEDLLTHIEADLEQFEVAESEATKNEVVTKHPETGEAKVTEYFRVWVRLRRRKGSELLALAEAMIETACRERQPPALHLPTEMDGVWQVIPIADPHFGKYSWGKTTGYEDYDLDIARRVVLSSATELIERGAASYRAGRRTIAFLGDVFHYDTPHGTTTKGTPLERDGRMPKMVDIATDTVLEIIERSAATCPTDVLFVRGNHDEALTTLLQKTVSTVYKRSLTIDVDATHTTRKYLFHQGTLLGFTHGDKAKRNLASLMPHEAKQHWVRAAYYEWHSGHTHAMRAEWSRPAETIDGVLVRVAPALCPADDWHADHGFVGALRAMESFFYRPGGGLIATHVSSPSYR